MFWHREEDGRRGSQEDPSTRERFRRLSIHEEIRSADGGDVDTDGAMKNPFSCAVYGEIDTLKELVQAADFDLDQKDSYGSTLLMEACRYGHLEIVEYLLSKMVRIDPVNASQQMALHFASGGGYHEIVRVLLNHSVAAASDDRPREGAAINVNAQDSSGKSALHWASKNDHDHCVRLLLAAKANPSLLDHQGVPAINWMSKFKSRATMGTDSERDETLSSRDTSLTDASWMLKKSFPGEGTSIENAPMGVSFGGSSASRGGGSSSNNPSSSNIAMTDEDWNSEALGGRDTVSRSVSANGDDAEMRRMRREHFTSERKFIEDALKISEHVDNIPEATPHRSGAGANGGSGAGANGPAAVAVGADRHRERNRVVTFEDEAAAAAASSPGGAASSGVTSGAASSSNSRDSRNSRPMSSVIAARLAQMQMESSAVDLNMSNTVVEILSDDDDDDESMI